jgi:hypothetical protein
MMTMVKMTESQKRFIESQRIPESSLFDASGMRRRRYQFEMEKQEKLFAYGVKQCIRGHETIRTRKGHCIQCDTARIAFMMRAYQEAYVYLAGSLRQKVIKIGFSETPWDRGPHLNIIGYGGIADWRVLYYAKFTKAGTVEFTAHQRLLEFLSSRTYFRENVTVECREIFACGYPTARDALLAASPDPANSEWEYQDAPL